jgi:hypothetical protein
MRSVSYLSCALLLGLGFPGGSPTIDAGREAAAQAQAPTAAMTTEESQASIDWSVSASEPQNATSPENSASQESAGQNPSPQNAGSSDALVAKVSAVEKQVVPLADEPHHQIVLRNDFVRVYSVSVQPLDATLIHKHDLPYLAVSLGATDVENDVNGKPPIRLSLQDGQVIYSSGGFAHAVRTDAGMVFRNITIELGKPQGAARNLCKQIVPGPLECAPETTKGKKGAAEGGDDDMPYFETNGIRVDVITVASGHDYVDESAKENAVLVAMTNANLSVNLGGEHSSFLHDGDVVWLPAGTHRKVVDFLGTHSSFLLVSLKDSTDKVSTNGAKQ